MYTHCVLSHILCLLHFYLSFTYLDDIDYLYDTVQNFTILGYLCPSLQPLSSQTLVWAKDQKCILLSQLSIISLWWQFLVLPFLTISMPKFNCVAFEISFNLFWIPCFMTCLLFLLSLELSLASLCTWHHGQLIPCRQFFLSSVFRDCLCDFSKEYSIFSWEFLFSEQNRWIIGFHKVHWKHLWG